MRASRYTLFILLIAAVGLRLLLLGSKSLWFDEALGLDVAQRGQVALWAGESEKFHPPLYYWLIEPWMRLGEGDFFLRFPSAVLGGLCIPLIYVLGKRLADRPVALAAAGLAAFSPLLIWYSQELRPYALLTLVGLIATISCTNLFLRPTVGWWALLAASAIAMLYLHYFSVLLLPVQAMLFVLLLATQRTRWTRCLTWVAGWIVAGLAFWPWLRTPSVQTFWQHLLRYTSGILTRGLDLSIDVTGLELVQVAIGVPIGLVCLFLCYVLLRWAHRTGVLQSLRKRPRVQALVAIMFVVQLFVAIVPRGYTIKRQLVPLWPYGLLLCAYFWPWHERRRILLIGALCLSLIGSLINITLVPKTQWRETAAFIAEQYQSGDAVLIEPSYMTIPFDYYADQDIEREGISYSAGESKLGPILEQHDRVWFIYHEKDNDPQQRTRHWLDEHAVLVDTMEYYLLRIRLYKPPSVR